MFLHVHDGRMMDTHNDISAAQMVRFRSLRAGRMSDRDVMEFPCYCKVCETRRMKAAMAPSFLANRGVPATDSFLQ